MNFFRKLTNSNINSIDAIMYSYDMQAGSYSKGYYDSIKDTKKNTVT